MADPKLEKVKSVYSFWGNHPGLYRAQDTITFLGNAKNIRRSAVQKLGVKKGDMVLEIACGSGRNFPYLMESVGTEGKIVGLDYSEAMVRAAKTLCAKNGWTNVELIVGDAAVFPTQERKFDGVLSILGISAVPGWQQALQHCFDNLKTGGTLVVCDAKLFSGRLSFLNPLVRLIYSRFAAWDPTKDIPEKMRTIFGNVETVSYNFGTFYIASSIKR